MTMILKVDLDGDVRRLRASFPENAILDNSAKWKAISDDIRAGFQLSAEEELTLKYKDEEGDVCTLVEDTLPDFLAQAQAAGGPVRVTASRKGAATGAAPTPVASAAAAAAPAAGTEQGGPDAAKAWEAWEAWRAMRRALKGKVKGKGKMCGWKGHWAEAAGPEEWKDWNDWKEAKKEAKKRWWQEWAMKHEHPLASSTLGSPWQCDGCWAGCDGGSAPRYRCTAGCDFDLCSGCYAKKAERDGWQDTSEAAGAPDAGAKDAKAGDAEAGDAHGDGAPEGWPDHAMFGKGLMKGMWKGKMKGKAKGMMKGMMKGMAKGMGKHGKAGKGCWGAPGDSEDHRWHAEPAGWPHWGPWAYHMGWPAVPWGAVDHEPMAASEQMFFGRFPGQAAQPDEAETPAAAFQQLFQQQLEQQQQQQQQQDQQQQQQQQQQQKDAGEERE